MTVGAGMAALLWLVALASAPPRPLVPLREAVDVHAGATCLDAPRLVADAAMWLERDRILAGIEVTVRGDEAGPRTVSFVISRDGETAEARTLTDIPGGCDQLHAAVALAVAVAIDTSVLGFAAEPEPEPEFTPEPEPESTPEPEPESTPEPEPEPEPAVRVVTRFGGSIALGVTDGPAYGGTAALTLRLRPRLDIDLAIDALAGPHGRLAGGRVRGVLVDGQLHLCGRLQPGRTLIRPCAALAAGALELTGSGFARTLRTVVPWLALGPGFDLEVPRDSVVAFGAHLQMWIPVVRARIVGLDDNGAVAASQPLPPVAGVATVGPVFRFTRRRRIDRPTTLPRKGSP